MMTLPPPSSSAVQTAVVTVCSGGLTIAHDVPIPRLELDMVLVRAEMVAINPADVKASDNFGTDRLVGGFEFSGTVAKVAERSNSEVPAFRLGDRVCGSVHGINNLRPLEGAFTQFVAAIADMVIKIPDDMSFQEAAALPVGVGTVALALQALFSQSRSKSSSDSPSEVLVYGASTASGTMALQYLKAMGHVPIATCSPRNFDLVKSYGAQATFDYHEPGCASDIRTYTKNRLRYVLDCVSDAATMEFCHNAIGRVGGHYISLEDYSRRIAKVRPTVRAEWIFQPVLFGRPVTWPAPYSREADPSMRDFGRKVYQEAQQLLHVGRLRPHPTYLLEGGFKAILAGVDMIRKKEVSGRKIVCQIPH